MLPRSLLQFRLRLTLSLLLALLILVRLVLQLMLPRSPLQFRRSFQLLRIHRCPRRRTLGSYLLEWHRQPQ